MKVTMQEKLDLILNLKAAAAQGIEVTDAMKKKLPIKLTILFNKTLYRGDSLRAPLDA